MVPCRAVNLGPTGRVVPTGRVGTKKCGTKVITVGDWWSPKGDAELT